MKSWLAGQAHTLTCKELLYIKGPRRREQRKGQVTGNPGISINYLIMQHSITRLSKNFIVQARRVLPFLVLLLIKCLPQPFEVMAQAFGWLAQQRGIFCPQNFNNLLGVLLCCNVLQQGMHALAAAVWPVWQA